jgi:hypothetical protein
MTCKDDGKERLGIGVYDYSFQVYPAHCKYHGRNCIFSWRQIPTRNQNLHRVWCMGGDLVLWKGCEIESEIRTDRECSETDGHARVAENPGYRPDHTDGGVWFNTNLLPFSLLSAGHFRISWIMTQFRGHAPILRLEFQGFSGPSSPDGVHIFKVDCVHDVFQL